MLSFKTRGACVYWQEILFLRYFQSGAIFVEMLIASIWFFNVHMNERRLCLKSLLEKQGSRDLCACCFTNGLERRDQWSWGRSHLLFMNKAFKSMRKKHTPKMVFKRFISEINEYKQSARHMKSRNLFICFEILNHFTTTNSTLLWFYSRFISVAKNKLNR